jgi:putative protease
MKLTAPLCDVSQTSQLFEAGADEIYCGVLAPRWKERSVPLNARPYPEANLSSFDELRAVLEEARAHRGRVLFCANARLGRDAAGHQMEGIARAMEIGVDGVIVADPSLVPAVKSLGQGARVIISTIACCMNSSALAFFAGCGADRVVLDRQLTLAETARLCAAARAARIEIEAFVFNITCLNVNGLCRMHGLFGTPARWGADGGLPECRRQRILEPHGKGDGPEAASRILFDSAAFEESSCAHCALCSLAHLRGCGIDAVKIEGRGLPARRIVAGVRLVREFLDGLEDGYIASDNCIPAGRGLYRKAFGVDCLVGQCHHFEIRRERKALG